MALPSPQVLELYLRSYKCSHMEISDRKSEHWMQHPQTVSKEGPVESLLMFITFVPFVPVSLSCVHATCRKGSDW